MKNSTNKILLENWRKNRSTMGAPKSIKDIYAVKNLHTGRYETKESIKKVEDIKWWLMLESEGYFLIFT